VVTDSEFEVGAVGVVVRAEADELGLGWVAVVPLRAEQGLVREALSSLYSLFATTREVLRRAGPQVAEPKPDGQDNLAFLAVAMLNLTLRPVWRTGIPPWRRWRPPGPRAALAGSPSRPGRRSEHCGVSWS
jgi:hypothetical protein